jgi:hypothetical protein
MTKIGHNISANEEGNTFNNQQVSAAQESINQAVAANRVAAAGLGDDMAGADALAAKSQIEFQRDTEFSDLSQVQATQHAQAHDTQLQTMGRVQNLFGNG